MNKDDIALEVRSAILKCTDTDREVRRDSKFTDDFGMDSLDAYAFIMEIEEKFDIEIPDDDVHKLPTVGDLVDYIDHRLPSEKAATA